MLPLPLFHVYANVGIQGLALLTGNPIWRQRTVGIGHLDAERLFALGVTGPVLRASGVPADIRRDEPYSGYETYAFTVPVRTEGDVYARYLVRVAEMRESLKLCRQALAKIPRRHTAWIEPLHHPQGC